MSDATTDALRWYAKDERYRGHDPEVLTDCGARARAALNGSTVARAAARCPQCGEPVQIDTAPSGPHGADVWVVACPVHGELSTAEWGAS